MGGGRTLLQYAQLLTNLCKCGYTALQLLACVTCRNLYADTRLALWHNRIVESGNEDTLLLQLCCEVLRQLSVVEHHCTDSRNGWLDIEACSNHLLAEEGNILNQAVMVLVALLEHLKHLDACTYYCRWQRAGATYR